MVFAFHQFLFDIYIFFNAHEQRKLTHAEGQILLFMNYGYYRRDYLFVLYIYIILYVHGSAGLYSRFVEYIIYIEVYW